MRAEYDFSEGRTNPYKKLTNAAIVESGKETIELNIKIGTIRGEANVEEAKASQRGCCVEADER